MERISVASVGVYLALVAAATLASHIISAAHGANSDMDCTTQLASLAPCLPFVQASPSDSNSSVDPNCCSALGKVRETSPQCLCQVISSSGGSTTPGVNLTRAEQLPSLCKINANASQCKGKVAGGPTTNPPTAGGRRAPPHNAAAARMLPCFLIQLAGLATLASSI